MRFGQNHCFCGHPLTSQVQAILSSGSLQNAEGPPLSVKPTAFYVFRFPSGHHGEAKSTTDDITNPAHKYVSFPDEFCYAVRMAGTRDFRKLEPSAQVEARRIAVELVKAGKTRKEAAEAVGVNRRYVGEWVQAEFEQGPSALEGKKRGRRAGEQKALSPEDEVRIKRLIADKCPDQLKLSFALWTREAVEAAAHIGCAAGDVDARASRQPNHRSTNAPSTARKALASAAPSTRTTVPFGNVTSIAARDGSTGVASAAFVPLQSVAGNG